MVRGGLSDEDREDLGKRVGKPVTQTQVRPCGSSTLGDARKGEEAIGQDPAPHTFLM